MRYQTTLVCACALLSGFSLHAQTQMGNDIDGEAANNWSGKSIDMPTGTTIAIGAQSNDEVASGAGHVRIFEWVGSSWTQKGEDINGRSAFDNAGTIVSMPVENTVAFGVPGNAQSANPYGRIEVHDWNGSEWVQRGSDMNGIGPGEQFGYALSMPDANTMAVGAIGGTTWPNNPSGKVIVYQWNGSDWVQKGSELIGEASGDQFGYAVSMPTTDVVAVSAPFNDGSASDAGHVRIYEWNGTDWVQKGNDLDGEAGGDNAGWSISMPNENTIAIGAPKNNGGGFLNGHTRIYAWNGSAWVQKGTDIEGEAIGDYSGFAVSMPDAENIAIGSPYSSESATTAGQVRVFSWNGTNWVQNGSSMLGEAQDDESGSAVSMPDANTVAIGAYENEGNGNAAGHVRIYALDGITGLGEKGLENEVKAYPNPATSVVYLEASETTNVRIVNLSGATLTEYQLFEGVNHIDVSPLTQGVYFIHSDKGGVVKLIKK